VTRLLQAIAGQAQGGAEAFFERLAIALAEAGETQRLVIRRDAARAARLGGAGLDVIEAPFGGPLDFATRGLLRRTIAAFRPEVVLSWMSRASAAVSGGDFVHVGRLGGYYALKHYRSCDHLVANTRDIAAYIMRGGWPAARVHYLPNFVAVAPAAPVARASLATPAGVPLALALGRLHPNKGFDVLLAAVAEVPHLHLWLAGAGDERAALEVRAAAPDLAGRVHFLGWRADGPALLAAADLVVVPSRREPLSNVVIEAWAAGVPVVAAASAGPRALIRDGENGLLVAVEDAAALAAALRRVIADRALARALAAGGRAAYEAEFAAPRVVGLYREFFAQVRR
jgi:glycosyltransferase involved in cell wall biosynthesis